MKLNETISIDALFDSFNQTYDIRTIGASFHEIIAPSGDVYVVNLTLMEGQATEQPIVNVEFGRSSRDGITLYHKYKNDDELEESKDSPIVIFSTVMSIVRSHAQKYKLPAYCFSGQRKLGSVYNRMVSRYASMSNFNVYQTTRKDEILFCLVTKRFDIAYQKEIAEDGFEALMFT